MINIAELLKDAPKGMKLYSPLFGEVEFMEVGTDGLLRVHDNERGGLRSFDFYGRYFYETFPDAECLLFPSKDCKTWEGWKLPVKPKYNDGDVLVLNGKPFIYSHGYGNNYCYIDDCGQFRASFNLVLEGNCVCHATKEQHDLLFAKMREAGYEWDADKKELRKIQPHYDISNFKPFDKVLVRDADLGLWKCDIFSDYYDNFYCFRGTWEQCIPFNEDTKHLLGTTNSCDDKFINW